MQKLNDVFLAAKEYYYRYPYSNHVCNFEKIAKAADVEINDLELYLNTLKGMGMVRYSMGLDKYLFLTGYGAWTKNITEESKER